MLPERTRTQGKCYEQACQIELDKAVAAQRTRTTKILRVGDGGAVTATRFDLRQLGRAGAR